MASLLLPGTSAPSHTASTVLQIKAFLHPRHGMRLKARLSTRRNWPKHSRRTDHTCRSPVLRASAEGLPAELLEDTKFVRINDDDPQFGPPAMMLMGLSYSEVSKVQELLQNMQGDFLKVLLCTNEMIKGTLWDAMNSSQPQLEKVKAAQGVPRICFLSGLTGEEIMMFVQAFPEAKLEPIVFAALVPNNAEKTVEELMEEIMGDHERLAQKS